MLNTLTSINQHLLYAKADIIKPAEGKLKHDYLVPAGPYSEQWDWDAFFMCISLITEDISHAKYLKNWVLNYLENSSADGKVPGCVTPQGPDPRLKQMKPLIAQGAALASIYLNDWQWLLPHFDRLKCVVQYRIDNVWSNKYGLAVWFDAMESGIDNNLAALDFPDYSVAAVDVNSFMYAEFIAMEKIAHNLEFSEIAQQFCQRAVDLKIAMNKYLWDDSDGMFYNLNTETGQLIRCISCSNFFPLTYQLASPNQAKSLVQQYLLNSEHMRSEHGLRTASKQEIGFNNTKMIKPHSNWQGPIWPIMTYLYCIGLSNYGYTTESSEIAESTISLVMNDIKKTGGMHENYNSETGEPLAAPYFVSWNLLMGNVLEDIHFQRNPLQVSDSNLRQKVSQHLINRNVLEPFVSHHSNCILPILTGRQRYQIMQHFIDQLRAARLGDRSDFLSETEAQISNLSDWDSTVFFDVYKVNAEFFETKNEWWNPELFRFQCSKLFSQTPQMILNLKADVTPFAFEASPQFLLDRYNWFAREHNFDEVSSLSEFFNQAIDTTKNGHNIASILLDRSAQLIAIVIASLYLYRCRTKVHFVLSDATILNTPEYLNRIQYALDMLGADPVNVLFEFQSELN